MINREAVKHFKKYMAQRIEDIVVTTPSSSGYEKHSLISNIFVVSTEHSYSAECLPKGHPMRRVLSKASVAFSGPRLLNWHLRCVVVQNSAPTYSLRLD